MIVPLSWKGQGTVTGELYHEEAGLVLVESGESMSHDQTYCYEGSVRLKNEALWFSFEFWRGSGDRLAAHPKDYRGLLERMSLEGLYNHFAHAVATGWTQASRKYGVKFWCERGKKTSLRMPRGLQQELHFMLAALDLFLQREYENVRDYPTTQEVPRFEV